MIELVFISIGVLVSFFVSGVLLFYSRKSPLIEMKILGLTFFTIGIFLLSHAPMVLLSADPNGYAISLLIQRAGFFIGEFGILGGILSIVLPNFKVTYRAFSLVIFTSVVCGASAVYNALTIDYSLIGDDLIRIKIEPAGAILWGLSFLVFGIVIVKRIQDVSKILKDHPNPFADLKLLTLMLIILIPGVGIMILLPLFPDLPSPGMSYTLSLSATLLYFIFAFSRDKAFFFITPASLDAVIITEAAGLTVFSKNFVPGLPAEQMIGGLFAALGISLQETIRAGEGLTEISFGDKVILLARGQWVTSLLIASEKNIVTTEVTNFITKEFEKRYGKILDESKGGVPQDEKFRDFEDIVDEIRYYIPL